MLKNNRLLSIVIFLFILGSSCTFRITNLDLIEFKADEAINIYLAARPLFGHAFLPVSITSSIGVLNPPLQNYILYPLINISLSPEMISLFIALLNSFSIAFFYLILNKFFSKKIALIASLLMAFSPWSIIYSRKIWAPDFIFPFFLIFFLSYLKIISGKKNYWFLYGLSAILLPQVYPPVILFILLLTFFLILNKPSLNLKMLVIGIFIGLIPSMPYFIYEIINAFPDVKLLFGIKEKLSYQHSLTLFLRPFQVIAAGNFNYILGEDTLTFANHFPIAYSSRIFLYIQYFLLPLSIFVFYKKYPKYRLLVFPVIFLPFLYFMLKIESFMHYFAIIIPILFLFLAVGISSFIQLKQKSVKIASFVILLLTLFSFITFNLGFLQLLYNKKTINGDYGTIFALEEKAAISSTKDCINKRNYQEILLVSYIPKGFFYGNKAIPKLLYNRNLTQKNLTSIEKSYAKSPCDLTLFNQLLSFYTYSPSKQDILILRKKAKEFSFYQSIYDEVYYNFYLVSILKKEFTTGSFAFEYPSHWKKEIDSSEIKLISDNYYLSISTNSASFKLSDPNSSSIKEEINFLGKDIIRWKCITNDNKWCGTYFEPISVGDKTYVMKYGINGNFPDINDKKLSSFYTLIDESLSSSRSL